MSGAADDTARVREAVRRGVGFLAARQQPDGRWDGEYGGPMFLLPLYVAGAYVTGQEIPEARRRGMIAYFRSVQNADGSIGLHTEAPGSMFCTALSYVALRILGVGPDDPDAARMRGWIRANGTPLGSAAWGKAVLALLNLYGYEGVQPIPPELRLLPRWLSFHPGRFWCHVRAVYVPLSYLYATRACCPVTPLIRALREELYGEPYERIRFARHRATLAPCDSYVPPSRLLLAANRMLHGYERRPVRWLRRRALDRVLDHVHYEDRTTNLINLGPINAVFHTVIHHLCEPNGPAFRAHYEALDVYLFESTDGLLMNGEDSTALWDTAFAVQALLATPHGAEHAAELRRAGEFIANTQILTDPPDARRYYRHPSYGGWASYEKRRGPCWLERLNPSHSFANIMVDYTYTECTSAVVQALAVARGRLPHRFGKELDRAIARGAAFIRRNQRPNGSWEGSWGVCFTIGAWYGINGLLAAGATPDDPQIRAAADFLLAHQNPDGGWPREPMTGAFNKTCLIHYDNCRRYFPLRALAEFARAVGGG